MRQMNHSIKKNFRLRFSILKHVRITPKACRDVTPMEVVPVHTLKAYVHRMSSELKSLLRGSVPYVKIYRYNPKHLYPKLNGYGDNGKRSLKV